MPGPRNLDPSSESVRGLGAERRWEEDEDLQARLLSARGLVELSLRARPCRCARFVLAREWYGPHSPGISPNPRGTAASRSIAAGAPPARPDPALCWSVAEHSPIQCLLAIRRGADSEAFERVYPDRRPIQPVQSPIEEGELCGVVPEESVDPIAQDLGDRTGAAGDSGVPQASAAMTTSPNGSGPVDGTRNALLPATSASRSASDSPPKARDVCATERRLDHRVEVLGSRSQGSASSQPP